MLSSKMIRPADIDDLLMVAGIENTENISILDFEAFCEELIGDDGEDLDWTEEGELIG
jgi:hypothetical protein